MLGEEFISNASKKPSIPFLRRFPLNIAQLRMKLDSSFIRNSCANKALLFALGKTILRFSDCIIFRTTAKTEFCQKPQICQVSLHCIEYERRRLHKTKLLLKIVRIMLLTIYLSGFSGLSLYVLSAIYIY